MNKNDLIAANPELWHEVTTPERDFGERGNAAAYLAAKDQHLLLVVTKNAAVLRKLNAWLGTAHEYLENCPTRIIDDEADQSTGATKKINLSGLTPVTNPVTPSDGAMADNTFQDGFLGAAMRVKLVTTGTYSNTILSVKLSAR